MNQGLQTMLNVGTAGFEYDSKGNLTGWDAGNLTTADLAGFGVNMGASWLSSDLSGSMPGVSSSNSFSTNFGNAMMREMVSTGINGAASGLNRMIGAENRLVQTFGGMAASYAQGYMKEREWELARKAAQQGRTNELANLMRAAGYREEHIKQTILSLSSLGGYGSNTRLGGNETIAREIHRWMSKGLSREAAIAQVLAGQKDGAGSWNHSQARAGELNGMSDVAALVQIARERGIGLEGIGSEESLQRILGRDAAHKWNSMNDVQKAMILTEDSGYNMSHKYAGDVRYEDGQIVAAAKPGKYMEWQSMVAWEQDFEVWKGNQTAIARIERQIRNRQLSGSNPAQAIGGESPLPNLRSILKNNAGMRGYVEFKTDSEVRIMLQGGRSIEVDLNSENANSQFWGAWNSVDEEKLSRPVPRRQRDLVKEGVLTQEEYEAYSAALGFSSGVLERTGDAYLSVLFPAYGIYTIVDSVIMGNQSLVGDALDHLVTDAPSQINMSLYRGNKDTGRVYFDAMTTIATLGVGGASAARNAGQLRWLRGASTSRVFNKIGQTYPGLRRPLTNVRLGSRFMGQSIDRVRRVINRYPKTTISLNTTGSAVASGFHEATNNPNATFQSIGTAALFGGLSGAGGSMAAYALRRQQLWKTGAAVFGVNLASNIAQSGWRSDFASLSWNDIEESSVRAGYASVGSMMFGGLGRAAQAPLGNGLSGAVSNTANFAIWDMLIGNHFDQLVRDYYDL